MKSAVAVALILLLGCGGETHKRPTILDDAGSDPDPTGGNGGSTTGTGGGGSVGTAGTTGGGGSGGSITPPPPAGGSSGGNDSGTGPVVTPDGGPPFVPPPDETPPTGNPYVYVSGFAKDLRIFRLDMTTGGLTAVGTAVAHVVIPPGPWPTSMAWDPARKHMYGVQENNPGRVIAYSINAMTGGLTRTNDVASGGNFATSITVHKSGKWALVANFESGNVAVLPIMPDGTLGNVGDNQMTTPNGPRQVVFDASGKYLLVPCTAANKVLQYVFDESTGKLTPNTTPSVDVPTPRHLALHQSQQFAYTINDAAGTVTSLKYDPTNGTVSDPVTIPAAPGGIGEHIIVHTSGKYVFASSRTANVISTFSIDPATGHLTLMDNQAKGQIILPRFFAQDPTGTFLLVANQEVATMVVFRIGADAKLTLLGKVGTSPFPNFIGIVHMPTP